jgi:hypothetical protein
LKWILLVLVDVDTAQTPVQEIGQI